MKRTYNRYQTMDISLYYEEKGEGFPLVLLHGNGEDHTYFKNQIEFFSKSRHVIAVDTRGHGKSPRGGGELSIRRFAEDLYEFFLEHGIEKADLLGFSDGGNIALLFALKNPKMVRKLILNGANLFPKGVRESVQFPIELGYFLAKPFANIGKKARKKAELLSLMVNDPYIEPDELKYICAPTLVIAGTHDMIKESHTRLIAEKIPGAKLKFIEGDHFIAHKNPDVFNKATEAFLNGQI